MTDGIPALAHRYDLLLVDLDGVVYVGERAVPEAADVLEKLRRTGLRVCYVTNNASRSASAVAELLTTLGVPAQADDVLTSAQAAAELLRDRLPVGSSVLVVGAPALTDEVNDVGLTAVRTAAERPVAVVQGYGPGVGWRELAEATTAVRQGALWVATNTDRTLPSEHGPLPGNGALVAAVATAIGRNPDVVVGKPQPGLFTEAVRRHTAERPLVVGDRLDTDIAGAVRGGYDSVLVLTGVATPPDVLAAGDGMRPTYLARNLTDLLRNVGTPTVAEGRARCGGWTVSAEAGGWRLSGEGEPVDALRALAAATWRNPGDTPPLPFLADGRAAEQALRHLGLTGGGEPGG